MYASQLLRILQTLPPHVNHEISAFDTAKMETIMKESQNGAPCDLNNCQSDAARLMTEMNDTKGFCNTPELECAIVVEDSTNVNENEVRGFVAPCTIPSSKMELFERDKDLYDNNKSNVRNKNEVGDSVAPCTILSSKMELFGNDTFYTDTKVIECELPELIICYKDNAYHVVKDICIDDGVPFKDKILIESGNDTGLCTILPSNGNKSRRMTEGDEIELLSPNGSKTSSENYYHEVDANEFGTKEKVSMELLISDALKSSSENDFGDDIYDDGRYLVPVTDKIVNDASRENILTNSMLSSPKFSKHKSLQSLLESPDCDGNEDELQSSQILFSEVLRESSAEASAADESNKSNLINDLPYNSKVESATITFDFNSSKPVAGGRDERPDDVDHEQPLKIDSEPRHEDGTCDSLAVESELQQQGHGESSFSMAGLITYSGPVAYSGSVSLRSDSSTTSTRSFAFPILHSEWNSSPVKMAKADRRHYRRHRGWRQGLLCCRF